MFALIIPLQGGIPGLSPEHPIALPPAGAPMPPIYYPPSVWPPNRPVDPGWGVTPPVDPGYGRPGPPIDPGWGVRPPVDPGYGRPGPRPPVDPGYGRPGPPVDPGWGVRPPVDPGYGRPGWSPVDPGYGQPAPPVGIWPSPPGVAPPIYLPPNIPERPINRPENPIALPPDQIWPPITGGPGGGAPDGGQWVLIFVPTPPPGKYEWVYLDLGGPK